VLSMRSSLRFKRLDTILRTFMGTFMSLARS
jgi:hypothetical protein